MAETLDLRIKVKVENGKEVKVLSQEVENLGKNTRSAGIEAATFDKNLKGNEYTSKNTTSQFAKQAQGMGGLVHVYATVAANVFALGAAYEVLKRNADLSIMITASEDLSRATGISFTNVASKMKELTGGAISFADAMRQASLGLSGGATGAQLEQITTIATKAANALGLSVPTAVGRMIQAVTKSEPELVDEFGIILRVTKATEDYAGKLGKTVSALSTYERSQAIVNQLIKQGTEKFGEANAQVNPFTKLSSSLSDLAVKLISFTSGPISAIATTFANSLALMSGGIALLILGIGKKALPELANLGIKAQEQLATVSKESKVQADKAKAAMVELEKRAKKLDAVVNIGKLGHVSKKEAGRDLESALTTSILPNLNKSKGRLGGEIAKLLADGIKEENLVDEFRKRGLAAKLEKAIEQEIKKAGSSGKFNKSLHEGNTLSIVTEDIYASKELVTPSLSQEAALTAKLKQEKILLNAERAKSIALAKTTAANASVEVLQARGLTATYKALAKGLSEVSVAYKAASANQSIFGRGALFVESSIKKIGLVASAATKAFTGLFSIISGFTFAFFIFESIRSVASSLGFLNKEWQENSGAMAEAQEKLAATSKRFKGLQKDIDKVPESLQEASNKWQRISNIAREYATELGDIIKKGEVLNNLSFWDKIWTPFDSLAAPGKRADNLITAAKKVGEATGKPLKLELAIPSLSKAQQKRINELKSKILTLDLSTREGFNNRAPLIKEVNRIKRTPEDVAEVSLNLGNKVELVKQLEDPKIYTALREQYEKILEKALSELNTVSAAEKAVTNAQTSIDAAITKLNNKSSSRQKLDVGTLISFRDNFKVISDGFNSLEKSTISKAKDSIRVLAKGSSEVFLKAFLPNINIVTATSAELAAATKVAVANMDRTIDSIQGYESKAAIIQLQIKKAKREQAAGDLSAISREYALETVALRANLNNLREKLGLRRQLAELINNPKQKLKMINEVSLLEQQVAAGENQLKLRNDAIPLLDQELEKLKRKKEVNAELSNQAKLVNSILASRASMFAISNDTVGKELETRRELLLLAEVTATIEQGKIDAAIREESLNFSRLSLEQKRVNVQAYSLRLSNLTLKKAELQSRQEAASLKAKRDLFDLENRNLGTDEQTGAVSSFATMFSGDFWSKIGTQLGYIGDDMGKRIANPIKEVGSIITSGLQSLASNLVSSIMNKTWDGKDEGRSMGVALREALKDTLRASIGKAITQNMTTAIVNLGSFLLTGKTTEAASRTTIISSNTMLASAIRTLASNIQLLNLNGGGSSNNLASIFSIGKAGMQVMGGNSIENFGDIDSGSFAVGGIVHRPTRALIGEGANSEAIVPLPDNRSIPVQLKGSSPSPSVSVTQSFDFSYADKGSEARLRQEANRIKQETIAAITDNINRGGNLAKVVGRR